MAQSNSEEQNLPADASEQGDQSNLEDTKPRRVVPQTVQPSERAEESVPPGEAAEEPLAETRALSVAPGEPPQAGSAEPDDAGAASLEETEHGFEHTIPPPAAAVFDAPGGKASASPAGKSKSAQRSAKGKPAHKKKVAGGKARRNPRRDRRWVLIPLLGLAAFLLVAFLGVAGGYASGIQDRRQAASTQAGQVADQQFQLGLQDMNDGNFDHARQRFEYVIQLRPDYPGAAEKLSEVLLYLNATATPTTRPTPTLTPTPDTRASDDLFNQAQQAVLDSNWDQAVESLLALRKKDEAYRPVEIDGLLYLALRNRGREKIVQTDLEGGIYDLTLAANFGPLDSEASGLLNWSQLYITGASFWEIDWAKVVEYFSQIAPNMPNLMDSSKMTASERLRLGLFNYGNALAQKGQACDAMRMYEQSLGIAPAAEVQSAYEQAAGRCGGGGEGGGNGGGTP